MAQTTRPASCSASKYAAKIGGKTTAKIENGRCRVAVVNVEFRGIRCLPES
jgi:hypothetical protein